MQWGSCRSHSGRHVSLSSKDTIKMGEEINVENLFHKSWLRPAGIGTLTMILYAPVGICLLHTSPVFPSGTAIALVKVKKMFAGNGCCTGDHSVIGGGSWTFPVGKVFVANHITKLDHLAIQVVTSALKPVGDAGPHYLLQPLACTSSSVSSQTQESLESSDQSFVVFPEGETTSGETGVLAFTAVEIPNGITVQPAAVKVSRHFFNTSSIIGNLFNELFIFLFLTNTHFSLRFLPLEVVDSDGSWKQKAQSAIAHELGLVATSLTPLIRRNI